MPWTAKQAKGHTQKATTAKKKDRWASIANSILKSSGDEAKAIRIANASLDAKYWKDNAFLINKFKSYLALADKDCPDCDGSGMQDGKDCPSCKGSGKVEDVEDDDEEGDMGDCLNTDSRQCPDCDGDGELDNGEDCPRCDGTGEISDDDDYGDSALDYKSPFTDAIYDTTFTAKQRKAEAKTGVAMKGGGFPIRNKEDLEHARQALGRAKNRSAAIAHIKTRAKALGVDLGKDWPKDSTRDSRPKTLHMYDRITLDDAAQVREIGNGYISAMPRIARTGIQVYAGDELGIPEMHRVRVYRPESEVFHVDAAHTYTHLPLTLDHPRVPVDSSNWKKYAVGETGDEVLRDGNAVRVPMMLRDAKAIKAFRDGTKQLSVGYDCAMEWTDGVTDDGEPYDAIQRGIRANHLAVVTAARGGSSLSIGDGDDDLIFDQGENNMNERLLNVKTILVDGLEVQVLDSAAPVIQRTIKDLEVKNQTLLDKFKKKEEDDEDDKEESEKKDAALKAKDATIVAKDKELESKNGEIAALKTQLADAQKAASPQAVDAAARERATVIDKACTLMGTRLKTDGMTVSEIRREVVGARIGNCKEWSDDRVIGAFDAMQTGNAFAQDRERQGGGQMIEDAVRVFGKPGTGYQSPSQLRDAAYNKYDTDISEQWRGKQS